MVAGMTASLDILRVMAPKVAGQGDVEGNIADPQLIQALSGFGTRREENG